MCRSDTVFYMSYLEISVESEDPRNCPQPPAFSLAAWGHGGTLQHLGKRIGSMGLESLENSTVLKKNYHCSPSFFKKT